MDELLEQFLIESRDLIAQASDDLAALARDPQSADALNSAFRAVHTLKGSVALFDMLPAERLLHTAEELLEQARKGTALLGTAQISALVAVLDQIDRWVDDVERTGTLGEGVAGAAEKVGALLAPASPVIAPPLGPHGDAGEGWLAALRDREADAIARADRPLTAFRYAPDPECFFRGDDPLAAAAAVPELVSLAILPAGGSWPAADEIEPFACFSVIEGLSTAPPAALSAAFRMMPDQVAFAALDRRARPDEGAAPEREQRGNQFLRVDVARVDALGDALGELLVAINAIAPLADKAHRLDRALAANIRAVQGDLQRVADGLRSTVSAVRSVPLEPALRRLPRLARDIAEGLGKPVEFRITGQDIEVDKQIADGVFEPLLHLVRNAIDHGIEPRERRATAGKPAAGNITLGFGRDGDAVVATLTDDGAGMDADRIRQAAIDRGVITADAAEGLTEAATLRLIFAPGFSTADTVTELSGRGVGMDAVRSAVEALRGSIEIESVPGRGTTFAMRFPTNALTTRLLVVEAGGDRYGVSLDQVHETVGLANERLIQIGDGIACVLHGRTVPVLNLAALLGRSVRELPDAKLLVTRSSGELVALRVDGFGERIDTLVRRSSGMLASVPGVIGSALLGDGAVLLVLDLPELAA